MRILVSRRDNFNYIITSEGLLLLNLTIAHLEWTNCEEAEKSLSLVVPFILREVSSLPFGNAVASSE